MDGWLTEQKFSNFQSQFNLAKVETDSTIRNFYSRLFADDFDIMFLEVVILLVGAGGYKEKAA